MKQLILGVILLTSLSVFSQNGGQTNENNVVKIQVVDYNQENVYYVVKVTNKQEFTAQIIVSWPAKDSTITFSPLETKTLLLHSPYVSGTKIKAKALDLFISNPDRGWVESQLFGMLPINFKNIHYSKVDSKTVKVTFDILDVSGSNTIKLQVSFDGVNYVDRYVIFPESVKPNSSYSVTLKL